MNNDAYDEILTYNQILEYMSNHNGDDGVLVLWEFKDLLDTKAPSARPTKTTRVHHTM